LVSIYFSTTSSAKINTYQEVTGSNSSTVNLDINSAADIDVVITD